MLGERLLLRLRHDRIVVSFVDDDQQAWALRRHEFGLDLGQQRSMRIALGFIGALASNPVDTLVHAAFEFL